MLHHWPSMPFRLIPKGKSGSEVKSPIPIFASNLISDRWVDIWKPDASIVFPSIENVPDAFSASPHRSVAVSFLRAHVLLRLCYRNLLQQSLYP